jgi:hypothetical protein
MEEIYKRRRNRPQAIKEQQRRGARATPIDSSTPLPDLSLSLPKISMDLTSSEEEEEEEGIVDMQSVEEDLHGTLQQTSEMATKRSSLLHLLGREETRSIPPSPAVEEEQKGVPGIATNPDETYSTGARS